MLMALGKFSGSNVALMAWRMVLASQMNYECSGGILIASDVSGQMALMMRLNLV